MQFKTLKKTFFPSQVLLLVALEIIIGTGVCLLCLFVFLKITREMLETEFTAFDFNISHWVYSFRSPWLTPIMQFFSLLGESATIVFTFLLSILFFINKHRKEALVFCLTLLMGVVINISIKNLIQRPRPSIDPLVTLHSYSFPSGHAMNAMIFYSLIAYYAYHFLHHRKLSLMISLLCGVIVLSVGISRVYLGVHYPSDVVAGFVAGFCWVCTVLLIDRTIVFYRMFEATK